MDMQFESNEKKDKFCIDLDSTKAQKKLLIAMLQPQDIIDRENLWRNDKDTHGAYMKVVDFWDRYTHEFSEASFKMIGDLSNVEEKFVIKYFLVALEEWQYANYQMRKELYVDYWKNRKMPDWASNIGFERYRRIYEKFCLDGGKENIDYGIVDKNVRNIYFGIVKKMEAEEKMDVSRWKKWPHWIENEYNKEIEILCRFCNSLAKEI